MSAQFTLDYFDVMSFVEYIHTYVPADRKLSAYLQKEGGQIVMDNIALLLPLSGRNWAGKGHPARIMALTYPLKVFAQSVDWLTLTVKSKRDYHYLYFPDDGSSTLNHFGNQQFMFNGAEASAEEIINGAIERLRNLSEV